MILFSVLYVLYQLTRLHLIIKFTFKSVLVPITSRIACAPVVLLQIIVIESQHNTDGRTQIVSSTTIFIVNGYTMIPTTASKKYQPISPTACPYHTAMANGESPGTESSTMSHDNNSSGMVRPSLRCLPLSMQRSSSLESLSAQQQQQHPNSSGNQQPHKRGNPSFRQAVDKNVPPSLPQTVGQTPWDGVTPPTKSFKRVQRGKRRKRKNLPQGVSS